MSGISKDGMWNLSVLDALPRTHVTLPYAGHFGNCILEKLKDVTDMRGQWCEGVLPTSISSNIASSTSDQPFSC